MSKQKIAKVENNNITLHANVKITKIGKSSSKPLKVKNNVTKYFLSGLARYVRGDFMDNPSLSNSFLPYYLGVGEGVKGTRRVFDMDKLVQEIPMQWRFEASPHTVKIEDQVGKVVVEIMTYIPSQSIVGKEIRELGLYSGRNIESNTLMARVELQEPIILGVGEALQIDWEIGFGNTGE